MFRRVPTATIMGAILLAGCSIETPQSPTTPGAWLKSLPVVEKVEPWARPDGNAGLVVHTAHYRLFTTVSDPLVLRRVPVFLESALRAYRETAGVDAWPKEPLVVYLFAERADWETFTDEWAGPAANLYRRIQAGAYFLNGATVAYYLDRHASFSVLAHEGWHQYAQQTFALRLPAWLDELMAIQFEAFTWDRGLVTFDPSRNGSRLLALKQNMAAGQVLDIDQLLPLDAGRMLSLPSPTDGSPRAVSGYYAQLYALGRFLREAAYGRHLLDLQALLQDAAAGNWPLTDAQRQGATPTTGNPSRHWNAQVGPLLFRRYITQTPADLDEPYRAFCRRILAGVSFETP